MTATGGQPERPTGAGESRAGVPPRTAAPDAAELRRVLRELVAHACDVSMEELDDTRPLPEYGLTSRDAVDLSGRLEQILDVSLPATLLWENPTIELLTRRLAGQGQSTRATEPATEGDAPDAGAAPIAVVGVGCRLPGDINGPGAFWQHLLAGTDAIGHVPAKRWRAFDDGSADTAAVLDRTSRWGGFLDDIEGFDADFFGIAPREAEVMDPQQRLLLEVSCEALDHAGIAPPSLQGTATGVFVGLSALEYGHLTTSDLTRVTAWTSTGAAGSIAANRLSYLLDLRGPSMTVDSACSSSLVAVHQACRSLRSGESDTVLAAGVNVLLSPAVTVNFDQADALAADGRCKPFDASADGITRGEGCGVVILRRLSDAQRDGDRILAVIRGTAVNSDGRSAGLMAPNPVAQQALLEAAVRDAGVQAGDIDYVEAHGTGTLLGDPIEAGALGAVLGPGRPSERPLLIGSVKSNLGHLEGAAGITGLIKTVLSLHHGEIPPSLHFHNPNPHIDFTALGLRVVTRATPWPGGSARPALAGVSAFGFGGTNAHVVLEQAPTTPAPHAPGPPGAGQEAVTGLPHVLLVTARSTDRLGDVATGLTHWLASKDGLPPLSDVAHTLAHHRRGPASAAVVARTLDELADRLAALVRDDFGAGIVAPAVRPDPPRPRQPVFVFSGYGSQWPGMGRRLLSDSSAFREAVDRLDPLFSAELGTSLSTLIRAGENSGVDRIQPLLFGLQYALADTLRAHGVEPAAVVGHSMGEVTAAVVAGALTLRDGLTVVLRRSVMLAGIDEEHAGAMAAVELSAETRGDVLARYPDVDVAVHSSPHRCTVAGPAEAVGRLVDDLTAEGRLARLLDVGGAGHSPAVDPILPALNEALRPVRARTPVLPWYSTVLDDPRSTVLPDAGYWCANARRPVRFQQAVAAAASDGHDLFLEIAPHPVAAVPLGEILADVPGDSAATALPTLHKKRDETVDLFASLTRLHLAGVPGPARSLWPSGRRVALPTPPWRHVRHWFPARRPTRGALGSQGGLGLRTQDPLTGRVLWQGDAGTAARGQQPRKLLGLPVLGLPACAELVLAAAADIRRTDPETVRIEDLTVHDWLPVSASSPITVVWQPSGADVAAVSIHSRSPGGTWVCHASARVLTAPDTVEPEQSRDAAPLIETLHRRSADSLQATGRLALAELLDATLYAPVALERPETVPGNAGSTSATAERAPASVRVLQVQWSTVDDSYRITCSASVDEETSADARPERWDIRARGSEGANLVAQGVQVRSVAPGEVRPPLEDIAFDIEWRKAGVSVPRPPDSVLLLTAFPGQGDQLTGPLAAALERRGVTVTVGSYPGDSADDLLDDWRDRTGESRAAVVMLFGPGRTPPESFSELDAAARVARRLAMDSPGASAPRLWLVTSNALATGPTEVPDPDRACLRGLVRVMALERPDLRVSLVDIAAQPEPVDDLVRELVADGDADEVAWRSGTRLVAQLVPADMEQPPDEVPFARPDGAYIITGGLTGLGLATARRLAETGAGRIVLNGRREPGPRTRTALTELGELGASVAVVQGDIADADVARRLVEAAVAEGHALRGVAHAAGVLHDRIITDVEPSDISAVFRPKVVGALRLDDASRDHDLDWWLVYSSAAALFGSPGQTAYAAANAWLDAMAHQRRAAGRPATSIAWGPWAEVGAAPDNPALAMEPIRLSEGLDALQALVTRARTYTGVVHLDAQRALAAFPGMEAVPFFADVLADDATLAGEWVGPDGIEALGDAAAEKVCERLAKRTAAVMGFAAQELDETTPLTDLGLDSLMTVRIRNAARHDFAVDLSAELLLRGAGLRQIMDAVLDELGLEQPDRGQHASSHGHPAAEDAFPPLPTSIGPRDAAERLVAGVWTQVLGTCPASVDDDLVEAAGDAHTAARALVEGIRRRLGDADVALSEEEVVGNRTVAAIADLIRPAVNGTSGSIVRTLRTARSKTVGSSLFAFHPAGGPTSVYHPLVQRLATPHAVFGLERLDSVATLEEKAAHYLRIITEIQPEEPYHLLGWSFGGCLAYEVACRLRDEGRSVGFLGLIDTILPAALPGLDSRELLLNRFSRFAEYIGKTYGHRLDLPYEELAAASEDQQIDLVMRLVAEAGLRMSPGILEHQRTSYIDARVGERYQPRPYEGDVVLYRAQEAQPLTTALDPRYLRSERDLGWAPLCPRLEVVPVPGDHLSLIDPPHVDVIAEHLTRSLTVPGG
ncbi:SDR family NAD(P)-dependent oxidoreductase [Streptomyces actuosus]|uniref:SDR family NAD(P)-dependent oxidoreductase n=1 Tax=Streptomyces actuosus TaxID=1885 RepID=A0ABS2VKI3_STRAS|nr:type I polyketide synthase [Streptomyces actuosus]MBN0043607.1 SDR family NAD(P)-dependent oxidoreductase [Streptomyces actuosus]